MSPRRARVADAIQHVGEELVVERPPLTFFQRLRRRAEAAAVDGFFGLAARATRRLPPANPARHGVEVIPDIRYRETEVAEHRLDAWRPVDRKGPLPVVLYIHGGRFARMSKETHWLFALMFARRGYLVLNMSYRLAPQHRYPAAHEDVCAAYVWTLQNAHRFGGDPSRIVVSGESAGGNLATSVALTACYPRREPFAREVFDSGVVPAAVVPACGILQLTDPERFPRRGFVERFMYERVADVGDEYLAGVRVPADGGLDLCDPVVALERGAPPARPLPPFFVGCGTWDVLEHDSRRLEEALAKLGATCVARYYERGVHAFHCFVMLPVALRYWRDLFEFLYRHVPTPNARQ